MKEVKSGLPQNYQKFADLSDRLSTMGILRFAGGATLFVALALLPREYQLFPAQSVIATGVFMLSNPRLPFNVLERRVFLQRFEQAKQISKDEGWSVDDYRLMLRPDAVIDMAKDLLPHYDRGRKLSPQKRFEYFEQDFNVRRHHFNWEENPPNMIRAVTRRALNIAETYWDEVWNQPVNPQTADALIMLDKIKKARATLATEAHLEFGDYNPRRSKR